MNLNWKKANNSFCAYITLKKKDRSFSKMIDVYLSLPSSVVVATGIVAENQVSRLYDLLFIHLQAGIPGTEG